jgi:O-acetyl-ADP-ribose deacetylase (regulator of RNase III)
MKPKIIVENIFDATVDAILHGANIHNTFGSGIALAIKNKYPAAYAADCETVAGDYKKLGTFTFAEVKPNYYVFNLYQQTLHGKHGRNLDYDAFYNALNAAKNKIESMQLKKIALPYLIGCDRAKGDWRIVSTMIDCIFENSPVEVLICDIDGKHLASVIDKN